MGILNFTTAKINEILSDSVTHFSDTVKHITAAERTAWNGKAPGGYGLGTSAVPIDDYNNAINNGWYRGGANYPSKINYAHYGMIRVDSVGQIKLQTFYAGDTGGAMTAPFMAIRKSSDSGATWSEWEYVNPPMIFGEEYRTTERYNGKPVYVKLVNFGALPNNTTKYFNPNITNFEKLIEPMTVTIAGSDSTVHDSPLLADTKIVARSWFKMTSGGIAIRTMEDCTSNSAVVKLKYTKTTN